MKCTWPSPKCCVEDPTQPIFQWLALGFCIGGNANFMFCIGGNANLSVFRYQHVGIADANFRIGGLTQREAPTTVVLRRSEI